MGKYTGDRSRQNRQRRRKLARRASIRALAKTLEAKGDAAPRAKNTAATES